MALKKDTTTIIFLNKDQNCGKPIRIKSYYIQHWKKIVATIMLVLSIPVLSTFYLLDSHAKMKIANSDLKNRLESQKLAINQLDTGAIKKHYSSIDEKLKTINKFLKARGLKPLQKNAGGEINNDLGTTEEMGSFYEEYLKRMTRLISFTPMGYPHHGRITSNFGHRENPFTGENIERHRGLDIKGAHGEIVKTTASGLVKFASRRGGYGNVVIVTHDNGFETYYGHLSKILVKAGQKINAGDQIGRIGSTGRSTGPHLHYEVHQHGKIVNPKLYLSLN
jgi:murein DD-endopeptidase MepM/ murein hydrolase activator NlpD